MFVYVTEAEPCFTVHWSC